MKKFLPFLLVIFVFVCSCSAEQEATVEPPTPTTTMTNTPMPTMTATATITPTETPSGLSQAEEEQLMQTYKVLLMIEINTARLLETAQRANVGDVTWVEKLGPISDVAANVDTMIESLPDMDSTSVFAPYWQDALDIQTAIKEIITQWSNLQLTAEMVISEVNTYNEEISSIMNSLHQDLISSFGVTPEQIEQGRQQLIDEINNQFYETSPPDG